MVQDLGLNCVSEFLCALSATMFFFVTIVLYQFVCDFDRSLIKQECII